MGEIVKIFGKNFAAAAGLIFGTAISIGIIRTLKENATTKLAQQSTGTEAEDDYTKVARIHTLKSEGLGIFDIAERIGKSEDFVRDALAFG